MSKLIYPLPVKRCKDKSSGEMYEIKACSVGMLLSKIDEELDEARKAHSEYLKYLMRTENLCFCPDCERCYRETAEEIVDVITAGITALEGMGYSEEERSELFALVNEKNRARGYLD